MATEVHVAEQKQKKKEQHESSEPCQQPVPTVLRRMQPRLDRKLERDRRRLRVSTQHRRLLSKRLRQQRRLAALGSSFSG